MQSSHKSIKKAFFLKNAFFIKLSKMLKIKNLQVEIEGKRILNDVNLHIQKGETHILFGPNGSGKTSLMLTIAGFSRYKITKGGIFFKGVDITNMPIHERAKKGLGISFQRPPTINGLKTRHLVEVRTYSKRNGGNLCWQKKIGCR